jgi:hypothetical protein
MNTFLDLLTHGNAVTSAVSVLFAVVQAFRARKYRQATGTLVDAIEQAATKNNAGSVKNVAAITAAAQGTKLIIDAVLERKGYKDRE